MATERTPPKSHDYRYSTTIIVQSISEPDLSKVINSPTNVTERNNKRTRILDECTFENFSFFKNDIMSMMNQLLVSQNNRLDKMGEYYEINSRAK